MGVEDVGCGRGMRFRGRGGGCISDYEEDGYEMIFGYSGLPASRAGVVDDSRAVTLTPGDDETS